VVITEKDINQRQRRRN